MSINGNTSPTFNVQYNNTQEQFTLAVDPIKIPNSDLYADLYEYRIPRTWDFAEQPTPWIDLDTNEKVVWVANATGTYFLHVINQDTLQQYQVLITR